MTTPSPDLLVELQRRKSDGSLAAWLLNNDGSENVRLVNEAGVPVSTLSRLPVDVGGAAITGSFTTQPSVVSTLNVPTGPLAANALFVGQWEEVKEFAAIQVAVFTDAPSASGGAVVEFSANAVDVIRSVPTSIVANFGAYFHLAPEARFVRFRYTNGATAQTILRLSIIYSYVTPAEVAQPLAASLTDANLATVVRSILAGRLPSGAYTPLAATSAGRLSVDTGLTPQTDALTDTQLRAAPVPVETELVQPLTNTELRASAVTVTGPVTNTELRASPLRTQRDIAYYASAAGGRVAFNITTQLVSFTTGGEQNLAALVNPSTSGMDFYLDLGEFGASINTTFRRYRNSTLTLSGTPKEPSNMGGGTATSAARMYPGGTTGSTFTQTGGVVAKTAHIRAFDQYLTMLEGKVVLRPGQSLAWTITPDANVTAANPMTASVFFEFWQQPAMA